MAEKDIAVRLDEWVVTNESSLDESEKLIRDARAEIERQAEMLAECWLVFEEMARKVEVCNPVNSRWGRLLRKQGAPGWK